jgi:hypothetical protein
MFGTSNIGEVSMVILPHGVPGIGTTTHPVILSSLIGKKPILYHTEALVER